MESGCHGVALADGDRVCAVRGDDLYSWPDALDLRRADENHLCRLTEEIAFPNRAVDLAAVSVAPDSNVERAESDLLGIFDFSRQEDGSGAGAKRRPHPDELLQLFKSGFAQEFEEGAGLATRNDETVDLIELLGFFNEHNFGAQLFQASAVRIEIALQGQYSNGH